MKKILYTILFVLMAFAKIQAQAVLTLDDNLQCGTYTYCIDIKLNATSGTFDLGTSSILLNYDKDALTFQSYTPNTFDSTNCTDWLPQQYDVDAETGEFSLTMKLLNANNCVTVNATQQTIGTLCFSINQQGATPEIRFNTDETSFNSSSPDNGTNNITIQQLDSLVTAGVLACDCAGAGTACDDNNVFTTNDQFDINCNCNGTISDNDNDGIPDGVDGCQDIVYEAEDAFYFGTGIGTNHLQYYGAGFIDYQAWQHDTLQFTINVTDAGMHDITFRYSNGNSWNRRLQVKIDSIITHQDLQFPTTDTSWKVWDTLMISHNFTVGSHTILLTPTPTHLWHEPNLDRLTVSHCIGCATAGQPCDDNDSCTTSDMIDINCNCAGVFQDSDNDGVCDSSDICPNGDDNLDTDSDGIPDDCDACDNTLVGTTCDDGNPCTINDAYDINCNCVGTNTGNDADNDGVCDTYDVCAGGDDNLDADEDGTPDFCDTCDDRLVGTPCDDGNPCTVLDVYDASCGCGGIPIYVEISAIVSDVTCHNFGNGIIDTDVAGSFGELDYIWNTGDTIPDLDSLVPGNYSVTVTDFRNCKDSTNYTITEPDELIGNYNMVASADSNGSIDLSPIGGILPYTFSWNTGDTTEDLTNLIPYTYELTLTDSNNCVENISIDVYPADMCVDTILQAEDGILYLMGKDIWNERWALGDGFIYLRDSVDETATYTINIPADGFYTIGFRYTDKWATRTAKISFDGTVEYAALPFPRTYDWANWQKLEFVQYLTAGTHQFEIAHATSNWGPWIDFISVCDGVHVPIATDANIIDNVCFADSLGAITVNPDGGTRHYSYLWSTGDTTQTITNLLAGDYYVTVTDEVGQTAIDTFTVNQPTEITPVFTMIDVKCKGQTNGRATVEVTGGTPNYSYNWSNGPTWKSTYNVPAGDYTLTVTDGNGCIDISVATVIEPDTMDAIFNNTVSTGSDGTIDLTPLGGNSPYTYYWKDSVLTEDRTGLAVGAYRITITDSKNCKLKTSTDIYPAGLCLDTIMQAEEGIYQNISYNIWYQDSATGRGYIHFSNDTLGEANYTFSVPEDGYYGIGFRYSNQYSTDRNMKIEIDGTVEYTDFPFAPTSNWKIYDFIDFNKYLTAGTHTLTLKHRQDWSPRIDFITVCDLKLEGFVAQTNITCHGDSTGAISVAMDGGRQPLQYLWNTGDTTTNIQNLGIGTYWVQVTDTLNQVFSDTIDIIQPLPVTPIIAKTDIDCNGNANGQATVNVTGGNGNYTYLWSNNATTDSLTNLNVGTYDLTVTDNVGCIATATTTITEPTILDLNLTAFANADCNGNNTGNATLSTTGGTAPYIYNWSNGQTTSTATNLSAGNYTPTVTDANGCTDTILITITEPNPLVTSVVNSQNVNCNGESTASISTTTTGGTSTYTYLWSSGQTTANIQNIAAGTYTLTATDANGCISTITETITEPTALTTQLTATDIDCNGNGNGSISTTTSGGTGNYTYAWSSGQTVATINNLQSGNYIVTITDSLGCTISDTTTINEPTVLDLTLTAFANIDCNGNNTGNATIAATGGNGNYVYSWNNGGTTTTINNLIAGNYIGSVVDSKGCTDTILVTITEPNPFVTSIINSQNVNCNGESTASISTTTTGGTSTYTYLWSSGQTTANLQNIAAGTYTLTATDANGCISTITETITEPTALTTQLTSTNIDCNGNGNGSISATTSGGTGNYTYAWSSGQTIATIDNLQSGNYTVTITDSLGCTISETTTITEPTALSFTSSVFPTTGTNGIVDLTVSGGSPTYTFAWSDGSTSEDRNDLSVGNYYVTITDANGCSVAERFTIFDENTCIDNIYQAEAATINANVVLNDSTGALGDGYTDFGTDTMETVTFNVSTTMDTTYEISIRYTQGTEDKSLAISIDGNLTYPTLTFSKTTDWNTWSYATFMQNLTTGSHNIELRNIDSDGPDIDYLSLCMTPDTTTSTIEIENGTAPISLQTYPNPVKNILNIDIELSTIQEGTLTIFDINGQVKYQQAIRNNGDTTIQKYIDVTRFASGIYFVQLKTAKGNIIKKVTVL